MQARALSLRQPEIPASAMTSGPLRIGHFKALVVFSSAVAVFAVVAAAVVMDPTVKFIDASFSTWVHSHVFPLAVEVMIVVSFLGAPSTLTAVTLALSAVLIFRHRYQQSIVLFTVVVGGNLLNVSLKHLLHRGRPVFEDPIMTLPTYSFPSGHATATTVFYGLAAAYAATHS
ncbi:MAG TPA: phosphatase PAP2 family protein, partial [Burkholderiales bacterium]|nr:phosphatase PAP2 family protein [Burkholderiales bacterium]